MSLSPWVGWGLTTLAASLLNRGSSASDESTDPGKLSITETKTGTPIPVVMGRTFLKDPLTIYYGDFRAEAYTETYAAHASFSAWPIILELIAMWATEPVTGSAVEDHYHTWSGGNSGGPVSGKTGPDEPHVLTKEKRGPNYLMLVVQWLLSWLINGRNLKTTIQKGFKYYLGYQQLWCWSGPGARIRAIYMDKYDTSTKLTNKAAVWSGDEAREAHLPGCLSVSVNDDQLFGGPDEQGGFVGNFHVYLGGATQMPDDWMVNQMKADSIQAELRGLTPAYRPYVSTVVPTAYVGKSATIPSTWLDFQWIPNRLGLGAIGEDANAAEIIYEIFLNEDWGMNESDAVVNKEALIVMGQKLKAEGLGITVVIGNEGITKAGTVIDAILEAINAVRYQEPTDGKWVFKLIRDDYDPNECLELNFSNCSSITITRLDWQETVGSISVTYSDRNNNYENGTVQDNDPAVIEIQGNSKTPKSYSYTYFTSAENALWAAKREAMQQGYPLATGSATGNRTLSAIRIGDVVKCRHPKTKTLYYMRVTDVDLGTFEDGDVKLELIEDVFSLSKTEYGYSGSTNWNPDVRKPGKIQDFRFMEMPYELMPEKNSYVFAMAARPDANTAQWNIWRNAGEWVNTNNMTKWTPAGRLIYDYAEFTDAIDMAGIQVANLGGMEDLTGALLTTGLPDIANARRGGHCFIMGNEILSYSSIERMANGNYLLRGIIRGCFDTVPHAHSGGEDIFFLDTTRIANVTTGGPVCKAGSMVTEAYTLTAASVDVTEEFSAANAVSLTTNRRAERPNPPAKVRMSCFSQSDQVKIDKPVGDIALSWTPRNKEMMSYGVCSQDDTAEYWTGQAYELPADASYLLRVSVGNKTVAEYTPSDSSFIYTWAQRSKDSTDVASETTLQLYTVKDGLESYQPQERTFLWKVPALIDAVESETDLKGRLAAWGSADRIVIPENDYTTERQLFYSDMPIFVIGTKETAQSIGAVFNYAGEYIVPSGQIAIVSGKDSYSIVTVDFGYIFRSFFVEQGSGGDENHCLGVS